MHFRAWEDHGCATEIPVGCTACCLLPACWPAGLLLILPSGMLLAVLLVDAPPVAARQPGCLLLLLLRRQLPPSGTCCSPPAACLPLPPPPCNSYLPSSCCQLLQLPACCGPHPPFPAYAHLRLLPAAAAARQSLRPLAACWVLLFHTPLLPAVARSLSPGCAAARPISPGRR